VGVKLATLRKGTAMAQIVRIGDHDENLRYYWPEAACWISTRDAETVFGALPFEFVYPHQCGVTVPTLADPIEYSKHYRCAASCVVPSLTELMRPALEDVAETIRNSILNAHVLSADMVLIVELWATEVPPSRLAGKVRLDSADLKPRAMILKAGCDLTKLQAGGNWAFVPPLPREWPSPHSP
jgi:hypothetical protein